MMFHVGQEDIVGFTHRAFGPMSIPAAVIENESVNRFRRLFARIEVVVFKNTDGPVNRKWCGIAWAEEQDLTGKPSGRLPIQSLSFGRLPQAEYAGCLPCLSFLVCSGQKFSS